MKYFAIASLLFVVFALIYFTFYVVKSFLVAYRKFENENIVKRFFMALGVALIKGIWANNGTPLD